MRSNTASYLHTRISFQPCKIQEGRGRIQPISTDLWESEKTRYRTSNKSFEWRVPVPQQQDDRDSAPLHPFWLLSLTPINTSHVFWQPWKHFCMKFFGLAGTNYFMRLRSLKLFLFGYFQSYTPVSFGIGTRNKPSNWHQSDRENQVCPGMYIQTIWVMLIINTA